MIFQNIAKKINDFLSKVSLSEADVKKLISDKGLDSFEALKSFVLKSRNKFSLSTLSSIIELANSKRQNNSAYFTNKFIIQEILEDLPDFEKSNISIIEPSVGSGNFLPFIFHKYADKQINLTIVDVDKDVLELLKLLYDNTPSNVHINYVHSDYMAFEHDKVDLIIGNPPFTKLNAKESASYKKNNFNDEATNLAEFFLEKAVRSADYISMIMPKNILNTPEYYKTRLFLEEYDVYGIVDFGEKGFKGVLVETINLAIKTIKDKADSVKVRSLTRNITYHQSKNYIFSKDLPYWVMLNLTMFLLRWILEFSMFLEIGKSQIQILSFSQMIMMIFEF